MVDAGVLDDLADHRVPILALEIGSATRTGLSVVHGVPRRPAMVRATSRRTAAFDVRWLAPESERRQESANPQA